MSRLRKPTQIQVRSTFVFSMTDTMFDRHIGYSILVCEDKQEQRVCRLPPRQAELARDRNKVGHVRSVERCALCVYMMYPIPSGSNQTSSCNSM